MNRANIRAIRRQRGTEAERSIRRRMNGKAPVARRL